MKLAEIRKLLKQVKPVDWEPLFVGEVKYLKRRFCGPKVITRKELAQVYDEPTIRLARFEKNALTKLKAAVQHRLSAERKQKEAA